MLDMMKIFKPKQKPQPVKEEPKEEPKPKFLTTIGGKVFIGFVVLHLVFLAYFIWFMVTASITESDDEMASIMRGEVEITKTTQLMTFIVHSVRNYIGF